MSRAGNYDYSDEYIIERLQQMAAQRGGTLTLEDYRELRGADDPSVPAIVVRKRWSQWAELAGIRTGRDTSLRPTVEKHFTFDDSLSALARFHAYCVDNGLRMTHHNYEVWQRGYDDVPCGSTCRYRLRDEGLSWSQAVHLMTKAAEYVSDGEPLSSDAGGAASA